MRVQRATALQARAAPVGQRLALKTVGLHDVQQRRRGDVHLGDLHLEARRVKRASSASARLVDVASRCVWLCRPIPSSGTSRATRSRASGRAPRAWGPDLDAEVVDEELGLGSAARAVRKRMLDVLRPDEAPPDGLLQRAVGGDRLVDDVPFRDVAAVA